MNVFPIAPAESRYLWFLIPVVVILLGACAVWVTSVRGAQASRFEIRADGLRLDGDLYGRLVPKSQLRVDLARRVDLGRDEELRPRWRRMGTGLDRKSTRLNSSHSSISYAVFCLKKKKHYHKQPD